MEMCHAETSPMNSSIYMYLKHTQNRPHYLFSWSWNPFHNTVIVKVKENNCLMLLIIWENCWPKKWNNTVIVIWNYFYSEISKFFCNNIATTLISVEKNIMKQQFKLLLKPSPSQAITQAITQPSLAGSFILLVPRGYFIMVLLFKNKWWKLWHWGNAADRLEPCLPYILISMNTWKRKIFLAKSFMIYHMKSSTGFKVMHLRNN